MATLADVGNCVTNLKARLVAAGFKVPAGPEVDNQTWAAAAIVASPTVAHNLAGRNLTAKDDAGKAAQRIAACNTVVSMLASRAKELPALVAQQKDVVTPVAEKRAADARKINIGYGVAATLMVAAAGVGIYYTLRS